MYSAERKNQANIAAAHSVPTTFDAQMLRSFRTASGISGSRTRLSMSTNATTSTAAAASRPSVVPDVHPFWLPLTIA